MKNRDLKINNRKWLVLAILGIGIAFNACKKDEDDVKKPKKDNEEEVITTLSLIFNDSSGVEATKIFSFRDTDGDGGNAPVQFDTIRLSANTTYYAEILLLNETVSPPDTISNEVMEEDDEHLFCFTPTTADVEIIRTDSDGTNEVGLESKWRAGNISSGSVVVVLKHQPDGLKDGSCSPGETDVEVDFVTEIN